MKSISKEEFVKIESINRHLKRAKASSTHTNWMNSLYKFFKVIDIFPDDFVRLSKNEIEDHIEAYVDNLKQRAKKEGTNTNSIPCYVNPLVSFLTFNRVDGMHEAWKRIKANFPEKRRSNDGKYNELQLQNTTINTHLSSPTSTSLFTPTQQDIQNINKAKASQTIAAEVNVRTNKIETKSIDNNVSVQTTQTTSDSLGVKVSASDQTGPKVIIFNLPATTINVANLKDLGVMYDGKYISPAPNMDAILHAKPADNPSFAIVVTQSGVQVLVLVPHFSTHSITITNMSKVIPAIPEFPFTVLTLIIATFSIVLIPKIRC